MGFKEVRHWKPDEVDLHPFEDWASRPIKPRSKEYYISLNIEVLK